MLSKKQRPHSGHCQEVLRQAQDKLGRRVSRGTKNISTKRVRTALA
ncbi:MAG TPA: hypothetical protein VNN20_08660 [Thermodesulfobacteriota bacterium]|nr:hypothetical protein [Thermodesulfobacteriota bacterium]